MPEPLTFSVSYPVPDPDFVTLKSGLTPAEAVECHRERFKVRPDRPLTPEDFRDFGQCCDLGVLGYSSLDYRPKYEFKPYAVTHYITRTAPEEAYTSLGLNWKEECERIAERCSGVNGLRVEEYVTKVKALDDAVLEVYRRRAVV